MPLPSRKKVGYVCVCVCARVFFGFDFTFGLMGDGLIWVCVCLELTGGGAMKNSSSEELDSYYPVRPECLADVPKTRFKARVCFTLFHISFLSFYMILFSHYPFSFSNYSLTLSARLV